MKTHTKNCRRSERGEALLLIAGFTLILTTVIGGATLFSMVATRKPIDQALENVLNNKATEEDMKTLQEANQNLVKVANIAAAGGGLIGPSGPIPDISDVYVNVIQDMTEQASGPPPTKDNPMHPTQTEVGVERWLGKWCGDGYTLTFQILDGKLIGIIRNTHANRKDPQHWFNCRLEGNTLRGQFESDPYYEDSQKKGKRFGTFEVTLGIGATPAEDNIVGFEFEETTDFEQYGSTMHPGAKWGQNWTRVKNVE